MKDIKRHGSIRKIGKKTVGVLLAGTIVGTGLVATNASVQLPLLNVTQVAEAAQVSPDKISVEDFSVTRASGDNAGSNIIEGAWNRVNAAFTIKVDGAVEPGDSLVLNHHFKTERDGNPYRETRFTTVAQNVPVEVNGQVVGEWTNRTITFNDNVKGLSDFTFKLEISSQLGDYRRVANNTNASTVFEVPMYLSVNGEDKAQTPLQFTSLQVAPDYNNRNTLAFTGDLNRELYNENGSIQADYGYSIKYPGDFANKGDVIYVEIDLPQGVSINEHMEKGNSNGGYRNQFIDDNRVFSQSAGYQDAVKVEVDSETKDTVRYKLTALEDSEGGFYSIGRTKFGIERSALGQITERRMDLVNPIETRIINDDGKVLGTRSSTGFSVAGVAIDGDGNLLTPPEILSVQSILVSSKGQELNLAHGVTAYDEQDGDITEDMEIVGADKIKYDTPGEYDITYRVTDSDGMTTEVPATVVVHEDADLKALEDRLNKEVERINGDIESLEAQNEQLQNQLDQLDETMQSEIERLEGLINDNTKEIEALKERVTNLEERLANAEGRIADNESAINDINAEINEINNALDEIYQNIVEINDTLDTHAERLDEHAEQLEDHEARISALEEDVETLENNLEALREHSDARDDALQAEIEANQAELEAVKAELEEVKAQADDNTERIEALEKEVEALKQRPIVNVEVTNENNNNNDNSNVVTIGDISNANMTPAEEAEEPVDEETPVEEAEEPVDEETPAEEAEEPVEEETPAEKAEEPVEEETPAEEAEEPVEEETPAEKAEEPVEEEKSEDAVVATESNKQDPPAEKADESVKSEQQALPHTGTNTNMWVIYGGLGLMAVGAIAYTIVARRKTDM